MIHGEDRSASQKLGGESIRSTVKSSPAQVFKSMESMREAEAGADDLHKLLNVTLQLRRGRAAGNLRAHVQQRRAAVYAILHVESADSYKIAATCASLRDLPLTKNTMGYLAGPEQLRLPSSQLACTLMCHHEITKTAIKQLRDTTGSLRSNCLAGMHLSPTVWPKNRNHGAHECVSKYG